MATNGVQLVRKLSNFLYKQQGMCGSPCGSLGWKWDVPQITNQSRQHHKYAVVVLNRPITQSQQFIKNFWNNAIIRVTVDGGTLQWDQFMNKLPADIQKTMKLPELITGDFDSITDDIMQKYKKQGCKIVHTPDQDFTDFTKALIELHKYSQEHKTEIENVIAIGQSSGRIDHVLGNIQTLYLVKQKNLLSPNNKVFIMSDDALSWLLQPGHHVISIPEATRKYKRAWCSLVPIGGTCASVATTGLKWNLDKQTLKFGDLVSTSNTFDGSDKVTIVCSDAILWSMRLPSIASQ